LCACLRSVACKSDDDKDDAVVADARKRDGSVREGVEDGSVREAVPLEISNDCYADATSIYEAPADLATADVERRGEVVRCNTGMVADLEVLRERFAAVGFPGLELTTGVRFYRIQYRTERLAGEASVATAFVFVTIEAAASPSPLVLFARGHADFGQGALSSLPIRMTTFANALAIAARGYPVIAPDYTGYVKRATPPAPTLAEDEAHSVLDATRALVSLLPHGSTSGEWVFVGASRGGHAVLSAQSFAGGVRAWRYSARSRRSDAALGSGPQLPLSAVERERSQHD
jgi:hypothetical protein